MERLASPIQTLIPNTFALNVGRVEAFNVLGFAFEFYFLVKMMCFGIDHIL